MKFTQSIAVLALLGSTYAQSSASSVSASGSVASSASSAVASAAPSGAGGASAAYLTAVLGALTQANLTGLAGVAQAIINTTSGQQLLGQLSQGNKTVFAPNNAAFAAVPSNVSSNPDLLAQILSYHILNTTYLPAGVQVAPAHTIGRTLLNTGNYTLPGNKSAPVVLAKNSTNATTFNILQLNSNVSAMGPVAAANLNIYIIDQVLDLPPSIADAARTLAPMLAQTAQSVGLINALADAPLLTVFAPNDAAFSAVASALGGLTASIPTILGNHIINGTAVYSSDLMTSNYTSASGSPFTFMSNSSGAYVMSGNSTARIIRSDVIVDNGVIHVIDGVLANTNANASAASSAYASNTAAAVTAPVQTAPVTASSSPAASASGSAAATSRSAGEQKASWNFGVMGMGAAVTAVGAMLGGGWVLM